MQFYKRTYGAVVYLVDADGKLVTDDTVYVEVGASGNPNACVLSLCSQNQELSDIIAAWGKTSAVFSSQELGTTDYTITIGDDVCEVSGEEATPSVEDFPEVIESISPSLPWHNDTQDMTVNFSAEQTADSVIAHMKVTIPNKEVLVTRSNDHIVVQAGSPAPLYEITLAADGMSATFSTAEAGSQDTITSIDWV